MKKLMLITRDIFVWALALVSLNACQKNKIQDQPPIAQDATYAFDEIRSAFLQLSEESRLFNNVNDSSRLFWEPLWLSRSQRQEGDSVTYYYVPMKPYVRKKNHELILGVELKNFTKYLILRKTASTSTFYIGTYLPETGNTGDTRFSGTLLLSNLNNEFLANFEYSNGKYKKFPIGNPNGLFVCSYVNVCNWVSSTASCGGFIVVATQGMAGDQPGRYFCSGPYDALCQNATWTKTDSYWKAYCVETGDPNYPAPPPPQGGNGSGSSDPFNVTINPNDVKRIPCASAYNFVRNGNYQNAVISDYHWDFLNSAGNRLTYTINVGMMETGMPYITYNGYIIQPDLAARIAAQGARNAELRTTQVLSAYLAAHPSVPPNGMDYTQFIYMFKQYYEQEINDILSADFYDGQSVRPARVYTNPADFALKDQSKYRTLKFWPRDCQ